MAGKRGGVVLWMVAAMAVPAAATPLFAQAQAVDQEAVATLRRMADYISDLKQFSVHTENTLEDRLDSGQRVDFDVAASVTVRRPNRLKAERVGELIHQEFYYDGETLAFFRPDENLYAVQQAPQTVEELLDYVRESLGMVIPVSDLAYRNVFAILMENVTSAQVIGTAVIGGVPCSHLAFRRPDVDFQVWVAVGDRPLPYKYVVTDTGSPALISTVTVMSDWKIGRSVPDRLFEFEPPTDAEKIEFIPYDRSSGFGR